MYLPFSMNLQSIISLEDPRVAAFCNLRDRTLRGENIFIAEGFLLVERLLRSTFATEAVLVAEESLDDWKTLLTSILPQKPNLAHVPTYVAPAAKLLDIAGFPFHRGVLALGQRRPDPTFDELIASQFTTNSLAVKTPTVPTATRAALPCEMRERRRWVIAPEITKPENIGHIFRTAGAFGIDAVLLGPRCCDPLCRRALRVSMGGALFQPFARSTGIESFYDDLERLKSLYQFELWATVLDPTSESLDGLAAAPGGLAPRLGVLMGNEFNGLDARSIAACNRRVIIPMHPEADSLNLGVATGVFCYAITRS